MRVLIVGAGIAGVTLAALLRQRNIEPVLIEKAASRKEVGYVLGLWPLGSRVLRGLGLYEKFVASSQHMSTYVVCDGKGNELHRYDMHDFFAKYGDIRCLMRSQLLDLLDSAQPADAIHFATSIERLNPDGAEVRVTFSDGKEESFDLVIGADGIHSRVRDLLFGAQPLEPTGWAGWAWWMDPAIAPHDACTEYWGAGRFFGIYPSLAKLCCFVGCPTAPGTPDPEESRLERIRDTFSKMGGVVPQILEALDDPSAIYHTAFSDYKGKEWHKGRILLIGDAGSTILPTAGIGASCAMESAAVLADELSRADASTAPLAVEYYVKRRRARVDTMQDNSRRMAKMMFIESTPLTFGRDFLLNFYSQEQLFKGFASLMDDPI